MQPLRKHLIIAGGLAVGVALVLAAPSTTRGCSVPVFRYALEHWQADPYVAVVFHRGELSDEQQKLVEQLDPHGDAGNPIANIIVRTVDLDDEPSDVVLDLWKQHQTDTLPLLSLQTSPKLGAPETAWHGELNARNVADIINSPIRQQIRERLLGGESVVWVFLESGNRSTDDEAFTLLQQELERLQGEIELPPIEEQDLAELTVDPAELRIAFSTLRLARDDEREQPLIEMLLRIESDLRDEPFIHQAMAFPIFGRGRALYALVGDGITTETIEDASRFLTGACQCTVKAQNPGVDLLMAVDWDQFVTPALPYDSSQPVLSGLASFGSPMSADVDTGAASATSDPATDSAHLETGETPADQDDADASTAGDSQPGERSQAIAAAPTPAGDLRYDASQDDSLPRRITLVLGLIVACVVIATLLIGLKSR